MTYQRHDFPLPLEPAEQPLHKVLPAGGPLLPGHPDYPMTFQQCEHCSARSPYGQPQAHFKTCPLAPSQCRLCGAEPGGQCNLQNQSRTDCRLVPIP